VSARLYHALYEHFRAAAERIAWWVFLNHPSVASLSQESSTLPALGKTMPGELEIEVSAVVDLVVLVVFAPDPHAFAFVERAAVVAVSASLTHGVREPESSLPPCDRRSVIPRKQRTVPLNFTMENKTVASLHTIGTNSLFLCFGILSNRVRTGSCVSSMAALHVDAALVENVNHYYSELRKIIDGITWFNVLITKQPIQIAEALGFRRDQYNGQTFYTFGQRVNATFDSSEKDLIALAYRAVCICYNILTSLLIAQRVVLSDENIASLYSGLEEYVAKIETTKDGTFSITNDGAKIPFSPNDRIVVQVSRFIVFLGQLKEFSGVGRKRVVVSSIPTAPTTVSVVVAEAPLIKTIYDQPGALDYARQLNTRYQPRANPLPQAYTKEDLDAFTRKLLAEMQTALNTRSLRQSLSADLRGLQEPTLIEKFNEQLTKVLNKEPLTSEKYDVAVSKDLAALIALAVLYSDYIGKPMPKLSLRPTQLMEELVSFLYATLQKQANLDVRYDRHWGVPALPVTSIVSPSVVVQPPRSTAKKVSPSVSKKIAAKAKTIKPRPVFGVPTTQDEYQKLSKKLKSKQQQINDVVEYLGTFDLVEAFTSKKKAITLPALIGYTFQNLKDDEKQQQELQYKDLIERTSKLFGDRYYLSFVESSHGLYYLSSSNHSKSRSSTNKLALSFIVVDSRKTFGAIPEQLGLPTDHDLIYHLKSDVTFFERKGIRVKSVASTFYYYNGSELVDVPYVIDGKAVVNQLKYYSQNSLPNQMVFIPKQNVASLQTITESVTVAVFLVMSAHSHLIDFTEAEEVMKYTLDKVVGYVSPTGASTMSS